MVGHIVFSRAGEANKLARPLPRKLVVIVKTEPRGPRIDSRKPLRGSVGSLLCVGGDERHRWWTGVVVFPAKKDMVVVVYTVLAVGGHLDDQVKIVDPGDLPSLSARPPSCPKFVDMLPQRNGSNFRIDQCWRIYWHAAPPVPPTKTHTKQWQWPASR